VLLEASPLEQVLWLIVWRSSSEETPLVPGAKGLRPLADEVPARWVWDSLTLLYWEPSALGGQVLLLGAAMVLSAVRWVRVCAPWVGSAETVWETSQYGVGGNGQVGGSYQQRAPISLEVRTGGDRVPRSLDEKGVGGLGAWPLATSVRRVCGGGYQVEA